MLMFVPPSLKTQMANAETYEEWADAAQKLDAKMGRDRWRSRDRSDKYDYVSIRRRLNILRELRQERDDLGLLYALNEGIHGNMGGIGKAELYEHAHFGTKDLICEYLDAIYEALSYLSDPKVTSIPLEEKVDFFRRAQHCFGRSALMMSGSGFLAYFHIGVVKALASEDLLPNIMSGASGGALVGSLACCLHPDELAKILNEVDLAFEADEDTNLLQMLSPFSQKIMTTDALKTFIGRILPDMTFQEAFEKTGRQLNISIAPRETHQKSRLLNAITSPNVYIAEAIMASAAVPGVYAPVTLMAKNSHGERQPYLASRKWVDGSISDDLPAKRLARLYGVNHYIVSQTNPHILPFVTEKRDRVGPWLSLRDASLTSARAWFNAGVSLMRAPLALNPAMDRMTTMLLSVVNQDYLGDINILPRNRLHSPMKILSPRSAEEIAYLIREGERATWPKIEMIRNQTKISRLLDGIVTRYEDEFLPHL